MRDLEYIPISDAIVACVNLVFSGPVENKVLDIRIKFSVVFTDGEVLERCLCLLIRRVSNYVLVCRYDYEKDLDEQVLEIISHHDSCWRTDGVSFEVNRIVELIENIINNTDSVIENQYVDFAMGYPRVITGKIDTDQKGLLCNGRGATFSYAD